MNSQIRCGSCREKVLFIALRWRQPDRGDDVAGWDEKTKRGRDKETKRRRDKKKKGQRQKPINGSAMNSPPTPPYCGSVAAALYLMNSQIRCGACREKVLFIALRWMQPDRGDDVGQAENPELAREFPAGTASKARQSRLHQAQGVFPVFVFYSFVQFLNISRVSCSKTNEWLFSESNS